MNMKDMIVIDTFLGEYGEFPRTVIDNKIYYDLTPYTRHSKNKIIFFNITEEEAKTILTLLNKYSIEHIIRKANLF